ncbi:polar amino acid transport system substrate-binding protein [Amycolatopsis lexingtonensis]|uniref:Polar amino acid transport system substrate-binding protein n=1 Tax=Amycolatopsis lexingtonensis TaxID=218822 RepID=A0ABR9HXY1_9PSEU|nr:transporter substrate-binding domain-containing protein [Amycolatopsis lexingtonensis]MBE1495786.1 polar amino acid transport system substrate-binding protein [Amycolatopsis lexingtonensis]
MRSSLRRRSRSAILAAAAFGLAATGCTVGGGSPSLATGTNLPVVPALHDALPQAIKDAGVLRFAGDSHPPYRTVAPDGTVTGIDADFQAALGQVLGVKTQTLVVAGLPAALQGMLADRYDAFNGPVKVTAEREKQFDTITWMTTRTAYVFPTDSTAGIARVEDLCGKRIAVVTASVVEEQLNKLSRFCTDSKRKATQTVGLDDTDATLLATRSGRADAAGMTEAAAIDVTQRQGGNKYVTQTEAQGASKDDLALYVPKSSGLGPVLQKAFEELFENGTYVGIMSRWGLNQVAVPKPVFNAATPR